MVMCHQFCVPNAFFMCYCETGKGDIITILGNRSVTLFELLQICRFLNIPCFKCLLMRTSLQYALQSPSFPEMFRALEDIPGWL